MGHFRMGTRMGRSQEGRSNLAPSSTMVPWAGPLETYSLRPLTTLWGTSPPQDARPVRCFPCPTVLSEVIIGAILWMGKLKPKHCTGGFRRRRRPPGQAVQTLVQGLVPPPSHSPQG